MATTKKTMATENKHYATRMKEEIAQLQKNIRELVFNPESIKSAEIRRIVFFERDMENALWAGDSSFDKGGDGILSHMSRISLDNMMSDSHNNMIKDSIEKMVDYCRNLEKDYVEGDGTKSGLSVPHELVQNGTMSAFHYASIAPAIVNYNAPYEIKIVDK